MKNTKNSILLISPFILFFILLSVLAAGNGNPVAGKNIFTMKACAACHGVNEQSKASHAALGPYLKGVSLRRSDSWIKSYLKNPMAVFQKDLSLQKNAGRYAARMPNLPLSDIEIEHLISYLKSL